MEVQYPNQVEMLHMFGFQKGMLHLAKAKERGFQMISRCIFCNEEETKVIGSFTAKLLLKYGICSSGYPKNFG